MPMMHVVVPPDSEELFLVAETLPFLLERKEDMIFERKENMIFCMNLGRVY
jgi:hypothetical protein